MKLYFKINNKWQEPDVNKEAEELLALNFTFDSLENPTDYISEYSYNIQLPKSAKNNKLFDEYRLIDSIIKYQPTERIEYIYISNGDTISNGEAYLYQITEDYYEFALNGALYTIFSKLLNSGWDKAENESNDDYTLLTEPWQNLTLSPATANISFKTDSTTFDWSSVIASRVNTIIFSNTAGLMPTTFVDMDGFNTKSWLMNLPMMGDTIMKVGDNGTTSSDTDDDELNSQIMAEYRCWKLRPYVYVLRLWQIYQSVCKTITGYDLELDERWYNEDYEYLKGLVYTLPMLDSESTQETNQSTFGMNVEIQGTDYSDWVNYRQTFVSPDTIDCRGANRATFEWDVPLQFESTGDWRSTNNDHFIFNPFQFIKVTARVTDGTTDYYNRSYIYVPQPNYKMNDGQRYQYSVSSTELAYYATLADEVRQYRYETKKTTNTATGVTTMIFGDITGKINLNNVLTPSHLELTFEVGNNSTSTTDSPIRVLHHYNNIWGNDRVELTDIPRGIYGGLNTELIEDVTLTKTNGSGSKLTMERLMGDVKPFQVLLKFSKMAGFIWLVDDYNKTIKVLRRADYFWDCFNTDMSQKSPSVFPYTGFYDITELTDNENYTITPLAWDSRNVILNFAEGETDYSKNYKEKYGYTYGSKLIRTEYKINNDSVELLGDSDNNTIYPPIFTAEWIKPLYVYLNQQHYKKQDDNYMVDSDNVFCYRLKNGEYSTATRINDYRVYNGQAYVLLSGDTAKEIDSDEYCWHFSTFENDITTTDRPIFSECNVNGYSILFAMPRELYSTTFPASKGVKFLYDEAWSDYISEVYDPDNKTIDVNAAISGQLYNRLKICPFVKLGNIGYLVMNIKDWTDGDLTSITLRQITSLDRLYSKSKSKQHTLTAPPENIPDAENGEVQMNVTIGGVATE